MIMKTFLTLASMLLLVSGATAANGKRPITFDDLMKVQRVSDPRVSPDGRLIAYEQGAVDFAGNKVVKHIWLMGDDGTAAKQLTAGDGSDSRPRWSPDGQSIAFISTRGGKSQVWVIPVHGGEARQLTSISTQASGVTWSGRGDAFLFTSQVYPDCADDDCNKKRLEEAEKSKVKARVIDELLFRSWNVWREGKYSHLFSASARGGTLLDLTPGAVDSPTWFHGAPDGYDISPDGREACFTSNHSGGSRVAWTTANDLFLVSTKGGQAKNITPDNPGSDASPQYSPDGRYIAYTSQAHDGCESDLFALRVYDRQTGSIKDLTPGFDQWVLSFAWAPDSDTIYFTAPERAEQPVFKTSVSKPAVEKVLAGMNDEVQVTPDGKSLVLTCTSLIRPAEIYRVAVSTGPTTQLTHANDSLMADLDMNPGESLKIPGALGAKIHSLLVKPPGFAASKKYPAIVLIHGGPQGAWHDAWSFRWNAQLFAARGYVVIMTNFHGSTGYGQSFVEEISGDWGGACYQDIMKAVDYLETLPYIDRNRVGAAGASFGGYMIDWIAGHTNRFKALVSHEGIYDSRSMYGETEEVWFDEWEHQGPPWTRREAYEKSSPSNHVQNMQTPMLVVQGALDYRVPEGQAFQLFTALQRRGVPSRLLYFPDEGHWVLKPQNSQLWYKTVLEWLDKYVKSVH